MKAQIKNIVRTIMLMVLFIILTVGVYEILQKVKQKIPESSGIQKPINNNTINEFKSTELNSLDSVSKNSNKQF